MSEAENMVELGVIKESKNWYDHENTSKIP